MSHYLNSGYVCGKCNWAACFCGQCQCGHHNNGHGFVCHNALYYYAQRPSGKGSMSANDTRKEVKK